MKKILLSIAIIFISSMSFSQTIDINYAKSFASKWLEFAEQKSVNDLNCVYKYSNIEKSKDYFFIFNSEENNSFIIISADERILPVLGYSDETYFDPNNIPPNMFAWLEGYVEEMEYIFSLDNISKHPDWVNIPNGNINKGNSAVPALLATKWNQDYPYNYYSPPANGGPGGRCYAGCVATAMSMILKYWEHPIHGYGSSAYYHGTYGVLEANYDTTYYEWNLMPNQVTSINLPVALLMYQCAISVKMQFAPDGSGAYTSDVPYALKNYFGYQDQCVHVNKDDYSISEWENMLKEELDLGRPMQYNGSDAIYGGHSFNLDGYNDNNQFHFNWGWSGYGNGYFPLTNLNSGSGNFTSNQGAVMKIEPRWNLYCNEPRDINGGITESTVTLNWIAPESSDLTLVEYQIYKNGTKIDATNDLLFIEENVGFGEYEYCVRALYDNECISEENICLTVNSTICYPPLNLELTTNGTYVNLNWDAPENVIKVEKYLIYRNGEFLKDTKKVTYKDNNVPSGDVEYCVTAIYKDADGGEHESEGNCDTINLNPVGIDNNENEVRIYPNPADDFINVIANEMKSISIIDNTGKIIKTMKVSGDNITLDTQNLSNGIYYLRITTDNNIISKKFVLSK